MFCPPFQNSLFICEKGASICSEQCSVSITLWVINGFQCIMKFLHVLSVRKRLNFVCFLPHPGFLHVQLGLDCLTVVAVGCFLRYLASIILMCRVQSVFFLKKPLNFVSILIKPVLIYAMDVLQYIVDAEE